jgi:hypothetical protein
MNKIRELIRLAALASLAGGLAAQSLSITDAVRTAGEKYPAVRASLEQVSVAASQVNLARRAMHLTQVTPTSCGWRHRSPLPHAARMAPLGEGTLAAGLLSERRRFPETSPGARRVGGDVGHGWVLRGRA